MATPHFCLSSNTYKNRVFEGFSRLQQSDEFVDMTLAAEGYLVKVHRTLLALASPFIKELLRSVPCQHPVLFLSNVSHKVLCFILEYIYTGEVNIPSGDVRTFLNAAQAMHIMGLENIMPPQTEKATTEEEMAKHVFYKPRQSNTANNACVAITDIQNIPTVNESGGEHNKTSYAPDKARSSNATGKACIRISSEENIPSATVNEIRHNEQASHICHPRLPAPKARITINTDFGLNIQQNNETNTEKQNEEISEFLSFMNVEPHNTTEEANVHIQVNTNNNINHDPSNMEMIRNLTNENINSIPMIIEGHTPLYPEQLLNNMCTEVTTTVDRHNNNDNVLIDHAGNNNHTDFSSLLNISSNSLLQDHDMAVDISISDLLDCDHVPTPSTTTEMNENIDINKNHAIDLTDDDALSPTTGNEMPEESIVKKLHTNDLKDSDNVKSTNTANKAVEMAFLNEHKINDILNKDPASIFYTISNRGSLQMIMSSFLYYCHHQRDNGRQRRWRCIDYRQLRCKASFDTDNNVIVASRKHEHCHPNHDEKIYLKIMKRKVFPSIKMTLKAAAEEATTKEEEMSD